MSYFDRKEKAWWIKKAAAEQAAECRRRDGILSCNDWFLSFLSLACEKERRERLERDTANTGETKTTSKGKKKKKNNSVDV